MAAYSDDLRRRVLDAALLGDASEQAVADRFGVSRSFVQKMKRLYRATGSVAPSRARRGPLPRLSHADREALADWLAQAPEATAAQLAARLAEERGVVVSRATVNRVVLEDGLRHKKKARLDSSSMASGAWLALASGGTAGQTCRAERSKS